MPNTLVGAWYLRHGREVETLSQGAQDWSLPPDLGLHVRSSAGDTLTAVVLFGTASMEQGHLLMLEDHGVYVVRRCDEWPSGEVRLTLQAHPKQ